VVEFELEQLPPFKARQLYKYVTTQVKENNKKLRRKEADARRRQRKKEMEISQKPSTMTESQPQPPTNMPPSIQIPPMLHKSKTSMEEKVVKSNQPPLQIQQQVAPIETKSATPEATKVGTANATATLPIDMSGT